LTDEVAEAFSMVGKTIAFGGYTVASQFGFNKPLDLGQVGLPAERTSLPDDRLERPTQPLGIDIGVHRNL
jgi:hypothetical protein